MSGEIIQRVGGEAELVYERTTSRPRRRTVTRAHTGTEFHTPEDVEIRTHPAEATQFAVTLGSNAKELIRDELGVVRRHFGEDRETGGWLYSSQRAQRGWTHLTIALATTAGDSWHGRYEVTFGAYPFAVSADFPPHLSHLRTRWAGDWHSHPFAGATVPSEADAISWVKAMDRTALSRYIGLIVSPSETLGFFAPIYSCWTVRREGVRLLPICEPARLTW